jgi:hypothetical protein
VLGFPVRDRCLRRAEIAAFEVVATRNRWLWNARPLYSIVARTRTSADSNPQPRMRNVIVAERLRGEELMEQVRAEIAGAARLDHLPERREDGS